MGCDVSQNASGIAYAGREAFIAALDHFDDIGINPSSTQFAIELRKQARPGVITSQSYYSCIMMASSPMTLIPFHSLPRNWHMTSFDNHLLMWEMELARRVSDQDYIKFLNWIKSYIMQWLDQKTTNTCTFFQNKGTHKLMMRKHATKQHLVRNLSLLSI